MDRFRRLPNDRARICRSARQRRPRYSSVDDDDLNPETANGLTPVREGRSNPSDYSEDSLETARTARLSSTSEKLKATDDEAIELYLAACRKERVTPTSYFIRHIRDTKLSLKHCQLGELGVRPLAWTLRNNNIITSLDLTDNGLGAAGISFLCLALRENCFITRLNLSENSIGVGKGGAQAVTSLALHNRVITELNISSNGLDEQTAEHLAIVIRESVYIEHLNLSRNRLGEAAGCLIGPAIAENSTLKSLDISWNCLRRKGAVSIAAGIKENAVLSEVNLSWNGFGLEGCRELKSMLIHNTTLTKLNLANNRITTEGAVIFGQGLAKNQTILVLKMGKNPMQSAGCYAICAALLKNPEPVLEDLNFEDIKVNKDFDELFLQVQEKLPKLKLFHGGMEPPKKPKARLHPMVKLQAYIDKHQLKLIDFFQRFDKDGSMSVSHEEFADGIHELGIKLLEEEIQLLVEELDKDGDGEINYSELVIGNQEFNDREKKSQQSSTASYG